jgi:RNA polymerase sigma factor (sigma-70 family)|tara:strand:- start:41649 stop:42191 length:543 start_codon:yes stop_codon:yes gene_type:complete
MAQNQIEKINSEQLVEEHADYLFQFAMSKIRNRDLALDFVQETMLVSLEKIEQFEGRSSLRTWMTTILNRKIIDYWRKEKRTQGTVDISDNENSTFTANANFIPKDPHQLSEEAEKRSILEICIDKLPDNWREIVHAKYYDEKNGEEISKEFRITSSNFWVIIHRAKAQLRDCMDKKYLS